MIHRMFFLVLATSVCASGCTAKQDLGSHGDSGDDGTPVPLTVLASNQNSPYTIAIDDKNVYWLNANGLGGVYSVSKSGGAVNTIATGAFEGVSIIAVDSTSVYVPTGTEIATFPLGGGPSKVLAPTNGTGAVVVANGKAYWLDEIGTGSSNTLTAKMVAVSGGTPTVIPLPSTITELDNETAAGSAVMTVTSDAVYASLQDGYLRIPLDGSAATFAAVPSFSGGGNGIAVDDTTLYFGTVGDVASIPLAGGNVTDLVPVDLELRMVSDGDFLYIVDGQIGEGTGTPGRILKVAKSDGTRTVLADNQGTVQSIAVDATSVYWNCIEEGTIKKIGK